MKRIKLTSIFICALLALAFLPSCEDVKPAEETIVSIRPRQIAPFPFEGGVQTIQVRTNQKDFDFSATADWIECVRIESDSLRIRVAEYEGIGSRAADLVISAGEGDLRLTRNYTIIQQSKYNMAFDQEDVDEEGWLWFNTLNKVNKYIGEDKLIKPFAAVHGERELTLYSDILPGADTLGIISGADESQIIGSIRLAKASSTTMVNDGGSIEIKVNSCSDIQLYLSSEGTMRAGIYHAKGASSQFEVIKLYGGAFQPNLSSKRHFIWNCSAEGNGIISKTGEQTIRIVNMTNKHLYIHGIKLFY